MKIISHKQRNFNKIFGQVCKRGAQQNSKIEARVKQILHAVERNGDGAVCRYVKQFDGLRLQPKEFRVKKDEIKNAYRYIGKKELNALRMAAKRIRTFHERQRLKTWVHTEKGVKLGQLITPLDVVGVYVPGGKALYPSTVLMSAIPAKVAGVGRVIMCTPTSNGQIHPYLLVAADLAGVDEVYRIGGVQAVGALSLIHI